MNHYCSGEVIGITYSECVSVALIIQRKIHIRHIVLSSVACPAGTYFSTLSQKRQDFRKNVTEHEMCILIFSTTFV